MIGQFFMYNTEPEGGGDPAPADAPPADPAPTGTILGGDDPAPEAPPADAGGEPTDQIGEQMKALWGDLADKIEWPEGLDNEAKLSQSLKPFVGKDGKLRVAELTKSYLHTKKKVGEKGVQVPTENSPQDEWDDYFKQVGWSPEIEGYDIKAPEGSALTGESLESFKKLLHENRVPKAQAQKIIENVGEMTKTSIDQQSEALQKEIEEGVDSLKKEWGQAFEGKIGLAKKVIKELGDEGLQTMLKEDPYLGSNPSLIKFLNGIGEKMYGEDSLPGAGMRDMAKSPAEAQQEINTIYGNTDDPYHKPSHPAHKDRVAHMQKLFSYKNSK